MKKKEIAYINENHKQIIELHISKIKKAMYFATEDVGSGKYQDYLQILDSVYLYSNNFHETMVEKKDNEGVLDEFMFLIPNMVFYTAIGYLTALKDGCNDSLMRSALEEIGGYCENATSELADVLIDEKEKLKMLQDISNLQLTKN
tara:strand:- start:4772 stop:5209 length:438 start_codon:yes stop_codon:yes gene_type:complete